MRRLDKLHQTLRLLQVLCMITATANTTDTSASTTTTTTVTTTTSTTTTPEVSTSQTPEVSTAQPPEPSKASTGNGGNNGSVGVLLLTAGAGVVAGIAIGSVLCVAIVAAVVVLLLWRRRRFCFGNSNKDPIMTSIKRKDPLSPSRESRHPDEESPETAMNGEPMTNPPELRQSTHQKTQPTAAQVDSQETYTNIETVQTIENEIKELPEKTLPPPHKHTARPFRDRTYTNMPMYDVPPHAFQRKQSYPGDLVPTEAIIQRRESEIYDMPKNSPERAFVRKESDVYVVPKSTEAYRRKESDVYVVPKPTEAGRRKESDVYVVPKPTEAGRRKESDVYVVPKSTEAYQRKESDVYLEPKSPEAYGRKDSDVYDMPKSTEAYGRKDSDVYDVPKSPEAYGRKESDVYVSPQPTEAYERKNSDLYVQPTPSNSRVTSSAHRSAICDAQADHEMPPPTPCSSRFSSLYLDMTAANSGHLKETSMNLSPEEQEMYFNMAQIDYMARKESYPGDIELPSKYSNLRKQSVPFNDEDDIYENQRQISKV